MAKHRRVSEHAKHRMKQRLNIRSPTAITRTANEAFQQGIDENDARGSLQRYIKSVIHQTIIDNAPRRSYITVKLYNGYTFIFGDATLITTFPIPGHLAQLARKLQAKKNAQ